MNAFAWTEHGVTVHITDDGALTRCGRPVFAPVDADDVLWFSVCLKCRRDGATRP